MVDRTVFRAMFGSGKKSRASNRTRAFFYVPKMTRDEGIFVTDAEGYIFTEFFKVMAEEGGIQLPPGVAEHPDNAANNYVRNYDMVIVMQDHEAEIVCYSVNYLNRLPPAFTERLRGHLGLMPDNAILWSDDLFKEPQEASAREVIFGQRPQKPPPKETRAAVRRKWGMPTALSKTELDYLSGKKPPTP